MPRRCREGSHRDRGCNETASHGDSGRNVSKWPITSMAEAVQPLQKVSGFWGSAVNPPDARQFRRASASVIQCSVNARPARSREPWPSPRAFPPCRPHFAHRAASIEAGRPLCPPPSLATNATRVRSHVGSPRDQPLRASRFRIVLSCHRPPRAVRTPRSLRAAAPWQNSSFEGDFLFCYFVPLPALVATH